MAGLDVIALALPPTIRHKLQCAGFRTTIDLINIGPIDLAAGAPTHTLCLRLPARRPQATLTRGPPSSAQRRDWSTRRRFWSSRSRSQGRVPAPPR